MCVNYFIFNNIVMNNIIYICFAVLIYFYQIIEFSNFRFPVKAAAFRFNRDIRTFKFYIAFYFHCFRIVSSIQIAARKFYLIARFLQINIAVRPDFLRCQTYSCLISLYCSVVGFDYDIAVQHETAGMGGLSGQNETAFSSSARGMDALMARFTVFFAVLFMIVTIVIANITN